MINKNIATLGLRGNIYRKGAKAQSKISSWN